jgi:hypothetical protein
LAGIVFLGVREANALTRCPPRAVLQGGALLAGRAALPLLAPPPPPAAAAATSAAAAAGRVLSRGEATSLVNQWQRIKAAALGPAHATARLPAVLRGGLLRQWSDRAAQLAAKGWHYSHDLQRCAVTAVAPGPAPGSARVTAALREGVTVHKGAGAAPVSYVSEYSVVYDAVYEGGAGWVITGATVQAA